MAYVQSLSAVKQDEQELTGIRGKDLALLKEHKLLIPDTFVILSSAFSALVEKNNLKYKIDYILRHVSMNSPQSFVNAYTSVRKTIQTADIPQELMTELKEAFEGITSEGIGLKSGNQQLRIILSPNIDTDPENNDIVIQNIQGWEEFMVAIQESWALLYHPTQLKPRMEAHVQESKIKLALIVQVMETPITCCHAYSSLPNISDKLFLQTYYGHLDLRNRIQKDYFALSREGLDMLASEVKEQPSILELNDKGELVLTPFQSKTKHDKIIDRELQELGRLTKKAERTLQAPIKCFFASKGDRHTLLWVNRLGFDMQASSTVEEPVVEESVVEKTVPVAEPKESIPANALDAMMQSAIAAVEEKFRQVFGPDVQLDRLSRMIRRLNEKNAWARQVDGGLLALANRAVHEEQFALSDKQLEAVAREVTFLTS